LLLFVLFIFVFVFFKENKESLLFQNFGVIFINLDDFITNSNIEINVENIVYPLEILKIWNLNFLMIKFLFIVRVELILIHKSMLII